MTTPNGTANGSPWDFGTPSGPGHTQPGGNGYVPPPTNGHTAPPNHGGAHFHVHFGKDGDGPSSSGGSRAQRPRTDGANGSSRGGGGAAGSAARNSWTNPLETIELTDEHALREFCEQGRSYIRYLAMMTGVAAEELEASLKELGEGHWAALGLDTRWKARQVARHLHHASEAMSEAAANFIRCWMSFEKNFAEVLDAAGHQPKQPKFRVVGG